MEGGKGGDGTKSETATRASNGADVLSFIGGQGGNYEYKKREVLIFSLDIFWT
jgi:hypothetical protein